jgi:hypothetical protein
MTEKCKIYQVAKEAYMTSLVHASLTEPDADGKR